MQRMNWLIFFSFSFSFHLFAQYTIYDRQLVKTTFAREFDSSVVNKYLNSANEQQVIAALLSVSHSNDTSWVRQITQLDFNKFGNSIVFALGQIGECRASTSYLLNKLKEKTVPQFNRDIFDALGKTGTKETLVQLLNEYDDASKILSTGLELAIVNFNRRGIFSDNHKELNLLLHTTEDSYNSSDKFNLDALYALSRIDEKKLDSSFTGYRNSNVIMEILNDSDDSEDGIIAKQFSLSFLRKFQFFPDDYDLLRKLLTHKDWRIRTEAIKAGLFYKFKNENELELYLSLLEDSNPNVSRQAGISIKNLKQIEMIKPYIQSAYAKCKNNPDLYSKSTIGEIFTNYLKLFPDEFYDRIADADTSIPKRFIYTALSEAPGNPEKSLEYINSHFNKESNKDKLYLTTALLSLSEKLKGNTLLDSLLLESLNSNFSPVIAITAESIDSVFIINHKERIKKIINSIFARSIDDPDYSETFISLAKLAEKIDTILFKAKLEQMKESKLFSIRSFAFGEFKLLAETKDTTNFNNFWNNAFKYKSAKVTTNKGEFVIEFIPEYAPISVGNFCYLTSTGYFNNVIFHRVVPNFVIQTGDKTSTGWGGPGYEIVSEFSPIPYERSNVGMASAGKDTEGSQWFVMHSSYPHLNYKYSNFGKVTEGMNVVDSIDEDDVIINIILNK